MEIVEGETYVELKYFRLSHSRSLKESYRFAIWQAQTFLGEAPPQQVAVDKGFQQYGDMYAMIPVGKDHITKTALGGSEISSLQEGKTWKIQFVEPGTDPELSAHFVPQGYGLVHHENRTQWSWWS